MKWSESHSVVFNSLWPHGLYTVHGILQARILEWGAFHFSKGSSQPRDWTQVSRIAGGFFTSWATREAQISSSSIKIWKWIKKETISLLLSQARMGHRRTKARPEKASLQRWELERTGEKPFRLRRGLLPVLRGFTSRGASDPHPRHPTSYFPELPGFVSLLSICYT